MTKVVCGESQDRHCFEWMPKVHRKPLKVVSEQNTSVFLNLEKWSPL